MLGILLLTGQACVNCTIASQSSSSSSSSSRFSGSIRLEEAPAADSEAPTTSASSNESDWEFDTEEDDSDTDDNAAGSDSDADPAAVGAAAAAAMVASRHGMRTRGGIASAAAAAAAAAAATAAGGGEEEEEDEEEEKPVAQPHSPVMSSSAACLAAASRVGTGAHILRREAVSAFGPCQGNKTTMIVAAAVTAALLGMPCIVVVCDVVKNAYEITSKLNAFFQQRPQPGAAHAPKGERIRLGRTVLVMSYTRSQLVRLRTCVVQELAVQPLIVLDEADKMWSSKPGPCDGCGATQRQRERGFLMLAHCLDTQGADHHDGSDPAANTSSSSTSAAATAPAPPNPAAAAAAAAGWAPVGRRLASIWSLVSVTATPLDVLAWHMQKQIRVHWVALERPLLARLNGYVGEADFRPFERDEEPLFLEPGQVAMGNQYGLQPCADDGSTPVLDCYDAVAAAAAAGQQGVDITNPRVVRGDGIYEVRCRQQRQQPGAAAGAAYSRVKVRCVAAFTGMLRCSLGLDRLPAAAAAAAAAGIGAAAAAAAAAGAGGGVDFDDATLPLSPAAREAAMLGAARAAAAGCKLAVVAAAAEDAAIAVAGGLLHLEHDGLGPDRVEETLQAVLRYYDGRPRLVICIIGYNMIRRSLSARTALRVPTHIICAPSFGTSLADFVQMAGRGMGNNRAMLQRYGLDCVRVLAMREDWEALQQYYDCVDYLHKGPGPLPAGLANGTLQSGLVNVHPRFGAVLLHARRQGQRRLCSGAVIRKVMHWEDEDEAVDDKDEEAEDEGADGDCEHDSSEDDSSSADGEAADEKDADDAGDG
ncbi:hypothetical protein COO60DRAFT_1680256 [Scenedesmus sp. NREL 46B-D3]|nr:hypothetical protein COO60DRAFT_1680256 [Scenedesmus sp. NREL 46B-D3]